MIGFQTILAEADVPAGPIIVGCLIGVFGIMMLFVAVSYFRRRINDTGEGSSAGFSLSDLRELHEAGQLSTEEYDRARGKMVAAAQAALARHEEEKRERGKR